MKFEAGLNHPEEQDAVTEQSFTAAIGKRVRAIRARRGMARKQLSSESDISERYLAQVESGQANTSIVLLHRLARAMMVPLTELLPGADSRALPSRLTELLQRLSPEQMEEATNLLTEHFEPRNPQFAGIALIGLRGGGKTQLGQKLARELELLFVRIREVVEDLGGMKMREIMALGGQAAFRRLEREALEWTLDNRQTAILEAGGSLVSEPETFQRLLNNYFTVWVKATPEEHMQRVIAQGDTRPMQGNSRAMDDLKQILIEREADYRKADYTLDTSGRSADDCFRELLEVTRPVYEARFQRSGAQ